MVNLKKGKDDAWYLIISDDDNVYKVLKIKLQKKLGML